MANWFYVAGSNESGTNLTKLLDSQRDAVGVPRELQHMGFSALEMGRLASEGAYLRRETMFAGYRTYFVAAVMFGIGAAMAMGFPIPEEVWMMLGAVGLGTLRAAVDGK